jgi:hypothetical protein
MASTIRMMETLGPTTGRIPKTIATYRRAQADLNANRLKSIQRIDHERRGASGVFRFAARK